jgi:hypothetical protein
MGLFRQRQKLAAHFFVNDQAQVSEHFSEHFDLIDVFLEAPLEDLRCHVEEGAFLQVAEVDHVEMAQQTVRYHRTTQTHAGGELNVDYFIELEGLSVVPASLTEPLSYQLQRRLGSVFFFVGHVDVIDEYDV